VSIKQKNFISAVVYLHNYEALLGDFLKSLYNTLNENFDKFEIICVNDASTDDSKTVIKTLANNFENCMLSIVNMSFYQGIEMAMRAGVDVAIGDFVFEFDEIIIDYKPDLIMQCYDRCLQGFDIVSCGNGNSRGSSKLFYSLYNHYSGSQYKLQSETFRIISRRAINRIHSMSVNTIYRKSLYAACGLKTNYIRYQATTNAVKLKKNNLKNPQDTALTSLILFTDIAYKATMVFTILAMFFTIVSFVYTVVVYISGSPVHGYTTMMALMSLAFFALFAILTVVIKYLSIILGLVFHRQKYTLESIEKIT